MAGRREDEQWVRRNYRQGEYSRQPRVGDLIDTVYGDAPVLEVHDRGRWVVVQTAVHGRQTLVRHEKGCWWRVGRAR